MKILLAITLLFTSLSAISGESTIYKDWRVSHNERFNMMLAETTSEIYGNAMLMIGFNPDNGCLPAVSTITFFSGKNTEPLPEEGVDAVSTWRIDSKPNFDVESTLIRSYNENSDRTMQMSTFHLKAPLDGTVDQRFLIELIKGNYLRTRSTTVDGDYQYDRFSLAGSSMAVNTSIDICLEIEKQESKYFGS